MQEQNQNPQGGQSIQVKASDSELKGNFANMLQVAHSQEEFILDFLNLFPPQGQLVSRVIVTPQHMKRITAALVDNLKRYEDQFGKIEAGQVPDHRIGFQTE